MLSSQSNWKASLNNKKNNLKESKLINTNLINKLPQFILKPSLNNKIKTISKILKKILIYTHFLNINL